MPAAVLKSFAKKSGKSIEDLERYWQEAKKAATEKGLKKDSPQFFAFVTAIVKNRAGLKESLEEFNSWVLDIVLEGDGEEALAGAEGADQAPAPAAGDGKENGAEEKEVPKNEKGETLLAQFARKKGMTEFQIEQIWNNVKHQGEIWQLKNKATDKETLEHSMKVFQDAMQLIPDAPPPEAVMQEPEEEEEEKDKPEEQEEKKPQGFLKKKKDDEDKKESMEKTEAALKEADPKPNQDKENASEEKAKEKNRKQDADKAREDRENRDSQDRENAMATQERIKKRKEAQAESMEKTEAAIKEAAGSKTRIGGNVLSIQDRRMLKQAGLNPEKDLEGLNDKQIKKFVKEIKKRNKERAKVTASGKGKKLGFLGSIFVGAAGFGAGFVASKAIDKAFSVFQSKTTNPRFKDFK